MPKIVFEITSTLHTINIKQIIISTLGIAKIVPIYIKVPKIYIIK